MRGSDIEKERDRRNGGEIKKRNRDARGERRKING